jgi:hypothetical protein
MSVIDCTSDTIAGPESHTSLYSTCLSSSVYSTQQTLKLSGQYAAADIHKIKGDVKLVWVHEVSTAWGRGAADEKKCATKWTRVTLNIYCNCDTNHGPVRAIDMSVSGVVQKRFGINNHSLRSKYFEILCYLD